MLRDKPVAMGVDECRKLIAARERTALKIGEAFRVGSHPQGLRCENWRGRAKSAIYGR